MNKWLLQLVTIMLGVITPQLREGLNEFISNLEKQAAETPNPWDDIFVGLLKTLLGVKED